MLRSQTLLPFSFKQFFLAHHFPPNPYPWCNAGYTVCHSGKVQVLGESRPRAWFSLHSQRSARQVIVQSRSVGTTLSHCNKQDGVYPAQKIISLLHSNHRLSPKQAHFSLPCESGEKGAYSVRTLASPLLIMSIFH